MTPGPLELTALAIIVVVSVIYLGYQYLSRALADPLEDLAPLENSRKERR